MVAHTGPRVVRVLQRVVELHGAPEAIPIDNGSEFTSHVVDVWAYERRIELDFIRPASRPKPGTSRASTGSSGTSA